MLGPEDVTSALMTDVEAISDATHDNFGIIPRAILSLFDHISNTYESHTDFSIKCSYIEVYNESVNDLLADPPNLNLKIREFPRLGMCVIGMTETAIRTPEEVFECLALGTSNRITGATLQNSRSSRSHTLFVLTMEQKFFDGSSKSAKLNLVDLAGSEKIAKTGAQGMRLREAQNINLSLTTLGRCIKALASGKDTHVPFRESKLTMILKESLGGNSKTTLLCTASPRQVHREETRGTLKFAERAKKIQVKAKVNKTQSIEELNEIIAQLKQELSLLRQQLGAPAEDVFAELAELRVKYERLQDTSQLEAEQQQLEDDEQTVVELQHEIMNLQAANDSLKISFSTARQEAEDLEREKFELEDRLSAAQSQLTTERMKVEEFEGRLERKLNECEGLELEQREQKATLSALQQEVVRLQVAVSTAQQHSSELELELGCLARTATTQAADLTAAKAALAETQESLIKVTENAAQEIGRSKQSEELLRLSLAQLEEEAKERRLERPRDQRATESRGVSKETIARLLHEMADIQKAYAQTESRFQKDLVLARQSRIEAESTADSLRTQLDAVQAANAKLTEALKSAEVEQDCQSFRAKLLREELALLTTTHHRLRHNFEQLELETEQLREARDTVQLQPSLAELRKQHQEAQRSLKEKISDLQAQVARLNSEKQFLQPTLEGKPEDLGEMLRHRRYESAFQGRRLSVRLTMPLRNSLSRTEDGRRSALLGSVNFAHALQNISAMYAGAEASCCDSNPLETLT